MHLTGTQLNTPLSLATCQFGVLWTFCPPGRTQGWVFLLTSRMPGHCYPQWRELSCLKSRPQLCVHLVGPDRGFSGSSKGRHCFLQLLWRCVHWQTSVFSRVRSQTTAGSQAVCQCAGHISHFSWYRAAELDFLFFLHVCVSFETRRACHVGKTSVSPVLVCIHLWQGHRSLGAYFCSWLKTCSHHVVPACTKPPVKTPRSCF